MRKIIDYQAHIATVYSTEFSFSEIVNALVGTIKSDIEKGWQPFGKPISTGDKIIQILVKYEELKNDYV